MNPSPQGDPPWLRAEVIATIRAILASHEQAFGFPLLAGCSPSRDARQAAQELFATEKVLLAHDGEDPAADPGPRLIYANRAALQLWQRSWSAMVGMPSRLTAEPQERHSRARALSMAQRSVGIRDYSGIRIDSRGRRFQILGARVWSFGRGKIRADDQDGQKASSVPPLGQAACFGAWHWL